MSFWTKVRNAVTKVAPVAIGFAIGGPVGAAVGGAAGSAARGGDIGQIIQGAGYGYGAGTLAGAGMAGINAANAASAAPSMGAGITPDTALMTGVKTAAGQAGIPTSLNQLSPSNILSTAGNAVSGGGTTAGGITPSNILQGANMLAGLYSAQAGAGAAKSASAQQAQGVSDAIKAQQAATQQVRADVAPFVQAGTTTAPLLTSLVNDPNAQLNFIQNNPFYASLAEDAKRKLLATEATKGKLGSGGTAKALQESLLLLGSDLLNRDITNKQNLASLGANAASGQGTLTQSGASNITGLTTDLGRVQSAGTMGAYNAQTGAINNLLRGATSIYGIDKGLSV